LKINTFLDCKNKLEESLKRIIFGKNKANPVLLITREENLKQTNFFISQLNELYGKYKNFMTDASMRQIISGIEKSAYAKLIQEQARFENWETLNKIFDSNVHTREPKESFIKIEQLLLNYSQNKDIDLKLGIEQENLFFLKLTTLWPDSQNDLKMELGFSPEIKNTEKMFHLFDDALFSFDFAKKILTKYDCLTHKFSTLPLTTSVKLPYLSSQWITFNKRLFLFGGISHDLLQFFPEVYEVDLKTGGLIPRDSFIDKEGRFYFGLAKYSPSYIIMAGGRNNVFLSSVHRYNVEENRWERLPNMKSKRCGPAAVVMNDEMLFVFQGNNGETYLNSVEKLELRNLKSAWEIIKIKDPENVITPRAFQNAVQIDNDSIFIFGGSATSCLMRDSAIITVKKDKEPISTEGRKMICAKSFCGTMPAFYTGKFIYAITDNTVVFYNVSLDMWITVPQE